jgi:hydroxypyruvate isomerase
MHWPYDVPAHEMKARCERHATELLGINTHPGDFAAGERGLGALPNREDDFRKSFDQALAYAKSAGGSAIHVMAGNVPASERSRAVFETNLRYAGDRSADSGITLLLEPLNSRDNPGYLYSTLAEAVSIIEALAIPNLKLQFDVYHVAIGEGDVLTKLRRYRAHFGNVQVAAVPSRAEPDEGEIAYRAIFDALDAEGYFGWVGCEYRPRAGTDAGLSWMRRLGVA